MSIQKQAKIIHYVCIDYLFNGEIEKKNGKTTTVPNTAIK